MSHASNPEILTDLEGADLESSFSIRRAVFVDEQGIPAALDRDGEDDGAHHVLVKVEGEPAAAGRVVVGDSGKAVLARIAVLPAYRGRGLGRLVVEQLHSLAAAAGARTLRLHPHHYLQQFYESLGYEKVPGVDRVADHDLITMERRLPSDG